MVDLDWHEAFEAWAHAPWHHGGILIAARETPWSFSIWMQLGTCGPHVKPIFRGRTTHLPQVKGQQTGKLTTASLWPP